jgi:hypothetical protein
VRSFSYTTTDESRARLQQRCNSAARVVKYRCNSAATAQQV